MDLETLTFLLTTKGEELLKRADQLLTDEQSHLRALSTLRKDYSSPIAAAAVETIILRRRAKSKFKRAEEMFFTKEALEQASGETVSSYRARRFANFARLADLPCGIGGDLINLAAYAPTLAVDYNPLILRMAEANAEVCGGGDSTEFRCADLEVMEAPEVDAIWFDPSRRVENRRRISLAEYSPPVLPMLNKWRAETAEIGIKVAPAIPYEEIPTECEVEFISDGGELKEAVFWFGALRTTNRRATILPEEATITGTPTKEINVKVPGEYLYEPDPAVIRAHLVERLAEQIDAWKLADKTAYLSSDSLVSTPFAQAYSILDTLPFNLKRLNEALKSHNAGKAIVKRRGSPVEPRDIEKKLKLHGDREITVILTRSEGRSIAILCQPAD